MAAVRMHIDKFDRKVLIDEDHPLAVVQRLKDASTGTGAASGSAAGSAAAKPLSRMNRAELVALCGERRIDVPEDASKKDIIALLDASTE